MAAMNFRCNKSTEACDKSNEPLDGVIKSTGACDKMSARLYLPGPVTNGEGGCSLDSHNLIHYK